MISLASGIFGLLSVEPHDAKPRFIGISVSDSILPVSMTCFHLHRCGAHRGKHSCPLSRDRSLNSRNNSRRRLNSPFLIRVARHRSRGGMICGVRCSARSTRGIWCQNGKRTLSGQCWTGPRLAVRSWRKLGQTAGRKAPDDEGPSSDVRRLAVSGLSAFRQLVVISRNTQHPVCGFAGSG
jgi:hypothetical protein